MDNSVHLVKRKAAKLVLAFVTACITILVMIPFLWMILLSFKSNTEIINQPFSLPHNLNFSNYVKALHTLPLLRLYKNTAIIAVFSQTIGLIITFMSSFAISRLIFKTKTLNNNIYTFFLAGLIVPSYILLFPIYRMNTLFHITNTYMGIIVPLIATSISFNTLLFVGFLRDFPRELEEAAIIDGANLFILCAKIVVPIIKPVIATITIFNVLYVWNEFPLSVTLINSPSMFTISLGSSFFRGEYGFDYGGLVAGTVLIVLPQLIFYGIFQKNIIEGMTAGAVKG